MFKDNKDAKGMDDFSAMTGQRWFTEDNERILLTEEMGNKGMPYGTWKKEMDTLLQRHGLILYIDPDPYAALMEPRIDRAIEQRLLDNQSDPMSPVQPDDHKLYNAFRKDIAAWKNMIAKVMFRIRDCVSKTIWKRLETHNPPLVFTRLKALEMLQFLKKEYGQFNQLQSDKYDHELTYLPEFKNTEDFDNGVRRLLQIQEERKLWNTQTQKFEWTETALKNWLLRRLQNWPQFQVSYSVMLCSEAVLTWDAMLDMATEWVRKLKTAASNSILKQPGQLVTNAGVCMVPNAMMNTPMVAVSYHEEDEDEGAEQIAMMVTPSNQRPRGCYNC